MKVSVHLFNRDGVLVGPVLVDRVEKSDAEWRRLLTAEQYHIARGKGTEAPFCGTLLDNKKHGVYSCLCCGLPLFSSSAKFNSGTGWPSFFQPIAEENVVHNIAQQGGYKVSCALCEAHLGHVFDDGPPPTGLRYCMDGVALRFIPWPAA